MSENSDVPVPDSERESIAGRRLLNFRPLVLIALCMILSLVAALYSGTLYIGAICFSLIASILIYTAAKGKVFTLALMIIAAAFSFLQVYLPQKPLPEIVSGEVYTVSFRAGEKITPGGGSVVFSAGKLTVTGADGTVFTLKAETEIEFAAENANDALYYAGAGDTLTFSARLTVAEKPQPSASAYYVNVAPVSRPEITAGKPGFFEDTRLKAKALLDKNAAGDTAALMYSVLFGDTDGLCLQTHTAYRISGLAHILAVSGLHVGLLAYSLQFVLRKLKAGNAAVLLVTGAVMAFYCCLCGFSPSVVRAAIMSVIFLTAKTLHKRYDPLSALAFAAVAILAFDPKAILSLSFKMSFLCMLSLIALVPVIRKLYAAKHIKRLYGRNRVTRAAGDAFALSAAAQIGVLPLMINYFNYAAVYNIPVNILAAPFLTLAVYLLYGSVFISLILPFMSFLIAAASWAFSAVTFIATVFSYLPLAAVTVLSGGALLYALYIISVFCGRFFMAGKRVKLPALCAALLLFITAIITGNAPLGIPPQMAVINCGYNGGAAVICGGSAVYAGEVTGFNRRDIKDFFFDKHIRKLDALVLTGYSDADEYYLCDIVNTFRPDAVYAADCEGVSGYDTLMSACAYSRLILFKGREEYAAGAIAVTAVVSQNRFIGVNFHMSNKNAAYILEKDKTAVSAALWAFPVSPDILVSRADLGAAFPAGRYFKCYNYTEFNESGRPNFTYLLENDIITVE